VKEEERSRYIRPSVVKIDDVNSSDAFTKGGFLKNFGILGALEETTEKKVINIKKTISLYKSDLSFFYRVHYVVILDH
jgi:hypothetical protein